jgi:hypothetical protein
MEVRRSIFVAYSVRVLLRGLREDSCHRPNGRAGSKHNPLISSNDECWVGVFLERTTTQHSASRFSPAAATAFERQQRDNKVGETRPTTTPTRGLQVADCRLHGMLPIRHFISATSSCQPAPWNIRIVSDVPAISAHVLHSSLVRLVWRVSEFFFLDLSVGRLYPQVPANWICLATAACTGIWNSTGPEIKLNSYSSSRYQSPQAMWGSGGEVGDKSLDLDK